MGSFAALAVSAPLLAAAACLIKLDDHGPVFHRQKRIGLDGRAFVIYKLRTMTVKHEMTSLNLADLNERVDGPLFKSTRDPRVTRIGRYLRASSIDELPQLWNVLSGSMSLVGPRPALPEETAQFDADLLRRLTVRPGLTGLWQIEARDNPSFNAYRRLDLHYVDNWSLLLDLNILLLRRRSSFPTHCVRCGGVNIDETGPNGRAVKGRAVKASGCPALEALPRGGWMPGVVIVDRPGRG